MMLAYLQTAGPAGEFNPTNEEYVREVVGTGVIVFIFGALVAVSFLIYFLVRWCCCCGGQVRSERKPVNHVNAVPKSMHLSR